MMSPITAVPKPTGQPAARVMFLYWGRRGAMPQFTLELGRAALANPAIEATICVSRQNEMFPAYAELGSAVYPVTTFATHLGAAFQSWRLPLICRQLTAYLTSHRIEAVVDLMPHVWSPFITHAIRAGGARYVPVLHDAVPHPGDPTTWVKRLIDRSLRDADLIVTLSATVAASLKTSGAAPQADIITLFHPDFAFGPARTHLPPKPGALWRLLFLGRIMPYKGLSLFLDSVDALRAAGFPIHVGVFGEGELGANGPRLAKLEAEVVNRWLSEAEIGAALDAYDAVVLSHTEASQSGVAAAALGAGVPVIATPVGGLQEQISDGVTGTLAARVDAASLAHAAERLFTTPDLYRAICSNISAQREARSMARFAALCAAAAVGR